LTRQVGWSFAGHAAFETFSVLTRLSGAARRTPATVARLLATSFPHSRSLGAKAAAELLERLDAVGVAESRSTTRWSARRRRSTA